MTYGGNIKYRWLKILFLLLLIICPLFFCAAPVAGHQPRLVSGEQVVEISNPEISQAFYASLEGSPHEYEITSAETFNLYLNILVPDLPHSRKDFSLSVFKLDADGKRNLLFELDGAAYAWKAFYEPFAGDRYYKGPEAEKEIPAGTYRISVRNPHNRGKYVLAVGKRESFSPAEMVQMVKSLPRVKAFFEKSPLSAFFNLVGFFLLLIILLLVGVVMLLRRLWEKKGQIN